MGDLWVFIILALLVAGITFFVTYFWLEKRAESRMKIAQSEADRVIEEAETKRREIALAAQDDAIRLRGELDRELTQRRTEIERIERPIKSERTSELDPNFSKSANRFAINLRIGAGIENGKQ